MLKCGYTVLPFGIYRLVSSLQYRPEFSLALGFNHEPSAAASLSAEGWLVQVNYCVFLQFACDPHIFLWGERSAGDLYVVTWEYFFQTYACCMDTFLYFHIRTWETFWLLGSWSEEHWVSLVSLGHDSLYIQYQPNMYSRGHFRSCIIFFLFCFVF